MQGSNFQNSSAIFTLFPDRKGLIIPPIEIVTIYITRWSMAMRGEGRDYSIICKWGNEKKEGTALDNNRKTTTINPKTQCHGIVKIWLIPVFNRPSIIQIEQKQRSLTPNQEVMLFLLFLAGQIGEYQPVSKTSTCEKRLKHNCQFGLWPISARQFEQKIETYLSLAQLQCTGQFDPLRST